MKRPLVVAASLVLMLCGLVQVSYGQSPTVAQLAAVQARHEASIMAQPGVIGIGIGQGTGASAGQLVFRVYVDQDAPLPALPADLDGVPVVTQSTSRIVTHNGGGGCNPCHTAQLPLPTLMGHSTSNGLLCYACTLGFKVCNPQTGVAGYVTNNHCNPNANGCENGPIGTNHFERALLDNGCSMVGLQTCGTSAAVKTLVAAGNKVDAAFIASTAAQSSRKVEDDGKAKRKPASVVPGDCIRKSGRTSGLTFGRVDTVNTTVNVGGYCQGTIQFIDQIVYLADTSCGQCSNPGGAVPCPVSLPGDSGSPVLLATKNKVVGLNFAGGNNGGLGVGNRVQNVLSELGGLSLNLKMCGADASEGVRASLEEEDDE